MLTDPVALDAPARLSRRPFRSSAAGRSADVGARFGRDRVAFSSVLIVDDSMTEEHPFAFAGDEWCDRRPAIVAWGDEDDDDDVDFFDDDDDLDDEDEEDEDEEEDEKPQKGKKASKSKFKTGQKVSFEGEKGKTVRGVITEIDGETAKVEDKSGDDWEVDISDLTAV